MALFMPPELWCTILNYLPCSDQLQVSQVSSHLCALARRAIFYSVDLRSNDPAVHATLALLARDHSVARNVKQLFIYTANETSNARPWFDPGVLAGMTCLSYLIMTKNPFPTKEAQEEFNFVANSLPMLRKLKLTSYYIFFTNSRATRDYAPGFHIRRLEDITWSSLLFRHPSPLLSLLTTSCSSLVHLHLPQPTTISRVESPITDFLALRFPHLSTLHFGGWRNTLLLDTLFTTFLLAHPLIEDLHLCFHYKNTSCHISSDLTLGPHALPRLRRLMADSFNLALLARSGVRALQTIESLYTGAIAEHADKGFVEMCGALEACGGLPGVRALALEIKRDGSRWLVDKWINGLGRLCPGVERFWGSTTVGDVALYDAALFKS